jgi:hypothetical protein
MHELARGETASAVVLPAVSKDECVRVAFAARAPVAMALVEPAGAVLAASARVKDGLLDVHGPVCFHPESKPSLRALADAGAGDAPLVRYVVWGAP